MARAKGTPNLAPDLIASIQNRARAGEPYVTIAADTGLHKTTVANWGRRAVGHRKPRKTLRDKSFVVPKP